VADDVILCASELAANAAIHSRSRLPGGTFTIRTAIRPEEYVLIEVKDNGGRWAPATSNRTEYHGLDIVRAVATECAIGGEHTGRTIWARFDWSCRS
jgi:anti-sigma regulatory factor (Ser/Thr protein kinase)